MSVSAPQRPRRSGSPRPVSPLPALATLLAAAAGAGTVWLSAPAPARPWVGWTGVVAWLCLAVTAARTQALVRADRRRTARAEAESAAARSRLAEHGAEGARIAHTVLPLLVERLREGSGADEALASVPLPSDPQLVAVLRTFTEELARAQERVAGARLTAQEAERRFHALDQDVERYAGETVPLVVSRFRDNKNHGDALHRVHLPEDPRLAKALDEFAWTTHTGVRRAKVAYGMVRHVLTKVQARNTTILHHLRDMQFRYGQEALKDLFFLDETASQLALSADRIAWMVGGRGSRLWTRPIAMESILRGAIGKIQSYRRVKTHNDSKLAIVGRSAEAIMHLLAEVINNAAQYSPPMDEVHVYVEERTAGIIVTVEDSGLKIPPAALPYLEDCIAGRVLDLAEFRNHHYGLNVVGILAHRFRLTVNFRPSSRGGTGVVILIPSEHIAQRQPPHPLDAQKSGLPAVTSPGAPPVDRARRRAERADTLAREAAGRATTAGTPDGAGGDVAEQERGPGDTATPPSPPAAPSPSPGVRHAAAPPASGAAPAVGGRRPGTGTAAESAPPTAPAAAPAPGPAGRQDEAPPLPARSPASRTYGESSGEAVPRSSSGQEGHPPTHPVIPAPAGPGPRVSTEHGLPVRPPGRTMAAVDQGFAATPEGEAGPPPVRDVGRLFGSFHRAVRAGRNASAAPQEGHATAPRHGGPRPSQTDGRSADGADPALPPSD
ncbi:ATP-binding protein [Streptomyces sp. NPDC007088]|uniref:ATP-binding protein n=1 Tax=Streptomyces sp. NPDC007088 TaxID=3364773 RepID=UPI0036B5BDBA